MKTLFHIVIIVSCILFVTFFTAAYSSAQSVSDCNIDYECVLARLTETSWSLEEITGSNFNPHPCPVISRYIFHFNPEGRLVISYISYKQCNNEIVNEKTVASLNYKISANEFGQHFIEIVNAREINEIKYFHQRNEPIPESVSIITYQFLYSEKNNALKLNHIKSNISLGSTTYSFQPAFYN